VAIVTGGSGGLAPAIAADLASAGMAIVLTARRLDRLAPVAAELCSRSDMPVETVASDALDPASTRALADKVLARFGRIDVLVNAAASSNPIGGPLEDVDIRALMADVDVKVGGYLRYVQAVVPVMKRQGCGQIVNIGGLTGRSSDTLSGLRNAAVSHLTKVLSDELGPFGIAVNAVHPGIVRTPHLAELFEEMAREAGSDPAAVESDFVAQIPTRTILSPEDIGRAVAFLSGPDGPAVTGQSITVDGGYSRGIYL
jgi:NAD(P)-dependent dehydrogenase (short-subunit alcohol dehydrogenase family)